MTVADLEALLADDSALCVLTVRRGVEREGDGLVQGYTLQLHRYAEFATVSELVLVTTRTTLARVPRELNGKRVHVAVLLAGIV